MGAPKYGRGHPQPRYLPPWWYMGGQRMLMDASSQAATIPGGSQIFEIRAETADVYFVINGTPASANSAGFVPQNGGETIGPLANLNSLAVYGAAGAIAHILYFREHTG